MVTILMTPVKMAAPDLLRIKVFLKKDYGVMTSPTKFYHVIQIIV